MTSAKFLDLLTHTPVTFTNQLILFLLSAFWGHPSPHPLRTSYKYGPQGAPSQVGPEANHGGRTARRELEQYRVDGVDVAQETERN